MAKRYVEDILTEDEVKLFQYARQGDWFIREGFLLHGEEWERHIPRDPASGQFYINALARYLFNFNFQDYQVALYYCPIPDKMIIGGRGSGKTTAIAIAMALRAILNPGHNWLHVAPTLEQARVMYDILLEWGSQGHFVRIFLEDRHTAPTPVIELRPWDRFDPGTKFMFRSIGGHSGQPMELLRSLEAGIISADEAFRKFSSDYYITILVGMARGPNRYRLNRDKKLRDKYQEMIQAIQLETNELERKRLELELDQFVAKHNLGKDFSIILSGNAPVWPCWWSRYDWGLRHPERRWCRTWWSEHNLYFTKEQQQFLRQQYGNDRDLVEVEMHGRRPQFAGSIFTMQQLDQMFSADLNAKAEEMIAQENVGWVYEKHYEYGLIRYREPPEKTAYAAGTDPGTGRLPYRNSWVILWCRLDGPPFRIVGLECGNLSWRSQGSLEPWIMAMKEIKSLYHFPEGHIAAEATGPQRGIHEVVWPDDLRIVPISFATQKPLLIMQAQLMLSRGMFVSPLIDLLYNQLLAYEYNDKKIDQDFVMAFLALVSVVWPYVENEFELIEGGGQPEETLIAIERYRELRDYARHIRDR